MMDKLAIMMSAAAIFAARATITAVIKIPPSVSRYAIGSTRVISTRVRCIIFRRVGYAIARIIHSWQIPNRSKYSKGVVTNET